MISVLSVIAIGFAASVVQFFCTQEAPPPLDPILSAFPGIPRNELDDELFSEERGYLRYDGDRSLVGVDVSAHQGEIDWKAVRESGVEFAIIRAAYRGYTEGGLHVDPMFYQNLDGARGAGLLVGAYVFSQAISAEEAAEEAQFVIDCLAGEKLELPVYFDWEYVSAKKSRTQYVGSSVVTAAAETFCAAVEEAGYRAGVYFNKSLGYTVLNLNKVKDYEFWLASYQPKLDFYFAVDMWQHTDSGKVPGISTVVDLNILLPKTKEAQDEPS